MSEELNRKVAEKIGVSVSVRGWSNPFGLYSHKSIRVNNSLILAGDSLKDPSFIESFHSWAFLLRPVRVRKWLIDVTGDIQSLQFTQKDYIYTFAVGVTVEKEDSIDFWGNVTGQFYFS